MRIAFFTIIIFVVFRMNAQTRDEGYPITPVPFTSVKVTDYFWEPRLKANREVTIPLALKKCEESGRYENFIKASHPNDTIKVGGLPFDDTDVYKIIEGASYSMQTYPDKKLSHYIDSILMIVATAQESDGYLYTSRTMNTKHPHNWAGNKRWEKVEDLSHEFYNLGHMIEGAIAHYQATGKKNFLNIAIRYADCVEREIGNTPDKEIKVPGHQIAEMALAKLYVLTQNKKYLDLAKFFLDNRGYTSRKDAYSQAHKPVIEQDEAVGHAVRAAYMYSGMADIAALTGDTSYIHAIDKIWNNVVAKKLYITGGIGARHNGEAFGDNYELPNMSAYCETCAAIGNVYWNYRMFLLHGDSRYYDILERTLYNGLISGVSLDGGSFFYPNPLESAGQHQRQSWFGCACCPSNIARFIPSLPGYIYAIKGKEVYINLFMSNTSDLNVEGKKLRLVQRTSYPLDGNIQIDILPQKQQQLILKVRVPGWVRNEVLPSNLYSYWDGKNIDYQVFLNGMPVDSRLEKGYLTIERTWKKGDNVKICFNMKPRIVKAHPEVKADCGRVAIERGPLVYCAEWPDNDFKIASILLPASPEIETVSKPDLLYGINQLKLDAQSIQLDSKGFLVPHKVSLTLIPYYAWAHRGSGDMSVWLPQELSAVRPEKNKSGISKVEIDGSHKTKALGFICDNLVPTDTYDRSFPYYQWWPKKGGTEWISYEYENPKKVSSSSVYWYDDGPWGGCRLPKNWKLYYKDMSGNWNPIKNSIPYPIYKGVRNKVFFEPVITKALKLEVTLPDDNSAGIYECEIE